MGQHKSHEEYVVEQKAYVVNIASQMLDGKIDIIEGARLIWRFQSELTDQHLDSDFLIFIVIAAETDGLPVGSEREHWATSALIEKDKQVKHAEALYREQALISCKVLIERFKAA